MISYTRRFTFLAVLSLVLVISAFGRAHSERESDSIVNDPEVRHGVLSNGLTYYVRPNATPAGMAELRLVIRAGSVLEDDDQLGLAHFLEHMLFNGTEKYPGNAIVDVLESFGMEFGPEINAYTTFEQTVYRLSVSTREEAQFLTGLEVLEEWGFNASLDEEHFEKERDIIHEEWRVGRGAQARMQDETYPLLFKGSRYAERRPIGDMDVVLNAPVEALRRFYNDWYRPDLMAVIAVGDFDPDEVVGLITERFGDERGPENPRVRPEYPIPRHDETLVKVIHDPEATMASVQLYRKYKTEQTRHRRDLGRDLAEQLFFVMLNQRLSEVSRSADPPFLYGYGFSNAYNRDTSLAGLVAAVAEEEALAGLSALLAEAERIQRFGFLASELERAKSDVMSFFENYWKQRNDMNSSEFVDTYLDAFIKGDFFPSVDWQWELVQDLLPGITLESVGEVVDRLLGDSDRVVFIKGPSVPVITDVRDEEIFEVLENVETTSLTAWEDDAVTGPLVENPPVPGRIIARSTVPGTDIGRWTLSNGAVLLFKSTDFKADEILFQAISHGGASRVADDEYISAQFATDAVSQGGLGEFSIDELRKVLTGTKVDVRTFIQESYEGFSGSTSPDDLETLFQLVYLHHTAARRDPVSWEVLMNRTTESLRNRESSPITVYEDMVWETVYDGHPRSQPITVDRLGEADMDEALDIYADRFRDAGDFTYVFVGDLDVEALEKLTILWLAGLPEAEENGGWIDRGMRNFKGRKEVSLEAGAEPLSIVTQVWMGEWDGSFRERYKIQSLAAAMEMKLTKTIREEYGGTYSVGVYPHLNVIPVAEYRFIIRYSTDPARVEELSSRVLEVVDEWRNELPDLRFAADVAANQHRSLSKNKERNDWWMGQIMFAVSTGLNPKDLMNREELYATLNPQLLMDSARTYLNDENYVEAVLYPDP